jgi:hypothetical protein
VHLGPDNLRCFRCQPVDGGAQRDRSRAGSCRIEERRRHSRPARPELSADDASLLAWSTLSVLASISFHRTDCPRPAYDRLLAGLVKQVIKTGLPSSLSPAPAVVRTGPLTPRSRREALLEQAIALFARKGYANGASKTSAQRLASRGASVYNHFPAKGDILIEALERGLCRSVRRSRVHPAVGRRRDRGA